MERLQDFDKMVEYHKKEKKEEVKEEARKVRKSVANFMKILVEREVT